jgi:uncharacterized repeat protein (TIGR03803 family)
MHMGKGQLFLSLFLTLTIAAVSRSGQAQTLKVLYSFAGQPDGAAPHAGLVRDKAGNFYGTTLYGGAFNFGTVFEVNSSGTETILYSFTGSPGDGAYPYAGLIRDAAGNFYGTTSYGGASNHGTVFKLTPSGTETVLHSFNGKSDGAVPYGGLIRDKAGNLYGTTYFSGTYGYGTLFKVTRNGTATVLHRFAGGAKDGALPNYTGLLMDKSGNVYGVTMEGGTSNLGVVYKFNKRNGLVVLHSFAGGVNDGCYPFGTLIQDATGTLYGTTDSCGSLENGTVWQITSSGKETVLHHFTGNDGSSPLVGVIRDDLGNLYGTTEYGGDSNVGTLYQLGSNGSLTVLRSFYYNTDGGYLVGDLIRDVQNNIYGTALDYGPKGHGSVWQWSP